MKYFYLNMNKIIRSLNYRITLNSRTVVILDGDGYLFIADYWNNRIVV
jgi:hypothetical protein